MAIVTMAAAAILIMPTLALSMTLTPIGNYYSEITSQTGPENTIDLIRGWLGYDDPLIGPGSAMTGVTFLGTYMKAIASAAGMQVVSWWQFWNYGSTQTATDSLYWAAIYQLNGDPGWTADISLNYTYKNSRLNLTFDGRSESKSAAYLYYDIVPASMTGNYSQNAGEALYTFWLSWYFPWLPLPTTSPRMSDYTLAGALSYDQNYYFAAISSADDTATGSFPMGSMEIGDQLYSVGILAAETQAQAYWIGVTIATMVSTLETNLVINVNPPSAIPEPTTMLLLGSGLIGVIGLRKKFKR